MVVLIALMILTLFMAGTIVVELFAEHMRMKADLPALTDRLKKTQGRLEKTIERSGLLKRQKKALLEVIKHRELTPAMRESLAEELLYEEKSRYDNIVRVTDLIARLGPMFGLMGTLIPLGPGIIALGRGDTITLSQSLLIAFDTTVAGLISAAIAYFISAVRKSWYSKYMSGLEMCMECVVELESAEYEKKMNMRAAMARENAGDEQSAADDDEESGNAAHPESYTGAALDVSEDEEESGSGAAEQSRTFRWSRSAEGGGCAGNVDGSAADTEDSDGKDGNGDEES